MAAECIFCKIVRGEIPCAKIYEDDHVLGFVDINPINPGHALVITKKHYPTLFEVPKEELESCITVSQKVAQAIYRSMGASGLNLLQNNFRSAGQVIDHMHFHLIPRHERDGFITTWATKRFAPGELEQTLQRIKAAL